MNTLLTYYKKVPYRISAFLCIFITFSYVPTFAQIIINQPIINSYAAVAGFDPSCENRVIVNSTAGFQPGNVVLIIQMQGAEINDEGNPININNAGKYERAVIAEIQGNAISFTQDLINYNLYDPEGKVQMVRVPQFINTRVIDTLTAAPWNGTTGGVLAFESTGTVDLRADINMNGKGFRGGGITTNLNSDCNSFTPIDGFVFNSNAWESAFKGEGIAAIVPGRELGKGAQANGGGGGNDHNAGGGGGANVGGGGLGGNNEEPSLFGCRGYNPGLGGRSVNQGERVFLGGGGGGGHGNNNVGTAGGNGGGIVYIKANTLIGNDRVISANGITALDGFGDGIGGGGGGGAILLDIINVNTQNLTVEARGGNGGNANNSSNNGSIPENRCFGPGGGGGGGFIAINAGFDPTEINPATSGGVPGITFNSESSCNGTSNGAQPGSNGAVSTSVFMPTSTIGPFCFTPTPVEYIYFNLKTQDSHVQLEWGTAREKNNDYFSIERSENGKDFYEIARVSGRGTYNDISTYAFADNNPLFGVSYYRIKQVDYDGKSAYTGIEPVSYAAGEMVMSIFPNPAQSQQNLNINIYSPLAGEATLRMYTLLGDEKYTRPYDVTKGAQTLELSMDNVTAGWYVVHLQIGNYYKVQKVKVVR